MSPSGPTVGVRARSRSDPVGRWESERDAHGVSPPGDDAA